MLPEQAPELPLCDSHAWDERRYRVFGWRDLRHSVQNAFCKLRSIRRQSTTPESRLARIVIELGQGVDGSWRDDPMLLERLEAQVAATDDRAVRKLFARLSVGTLNRGNGQRKSRMFVPTKASPIF